MVITFLSDYGLADPFVGVCHAVIARIAPRVRVIDLGHGVGRQDVRAGAVLLADATPFLPQGVHLAVVDPGVGTGRAAIVIRTHDGCLLVGPDNGLLRPAAERLGGIAGAWAVTASEFMLEPVSKTFHGRDVFAPAAAHLARGLEPERLGPALDVGALVDLDLPVPVVDGHTLAAQVLTVDVYGNLQLCARLEDLDAAGLPRTVTARAGDRVLPALRCDTFAGVGAGGMALVVDSWGRLALAVNGGSAAAALSCGSGDTVVIEPATGGRGALSD